jgi:CRISPR system Cascade subunit CasC
MKIEIHVLQNFAPSNLNRDDTNTPKTCYFGNAPRARLSSQCFKRAVREYVRDNALAETGVRTKRIKKSLTERLKEIKPDADQLSLALNAFIDACYSGRDSARHDETSVLLYIGAAELAVAAQLVLEYWDTLVPIGLARAKYDALTAEQKKDKKNKEPEGWKPTKDITKQLTEARLSADIALFGRMLAENPERNIDAACQVAHALSTHSVNLETDFYTAVDDLNERDETGAGMLGNTGYSSACYYRYALIDREQLLRNLGNDATLADEALAAFLEAFVQAIPTGKQNSMAAQNRPSLGLFVVREKGVPCSLANAFTRPVRGEDLIEQSKTALADYFDRMNRVYELYSPENGASCHLFHDGTDAPSHLKAYDSGTLSKAIKATLLAVRGELVQ